MINNGLLRSMLLLALLFFSPFILSQEKTERDNKPSALNIKITKGDLRLPQEVEKNSTPQRMDKVSDYYRPTQSLTESWDGAAWISYQLGLYTYDENGYESEYKSQSWDGSTWENNSKVLYTYENGYTTVYTYQSWNGAQWLNSSRDSYVYDSFGYTQIYLSQTGDSLSWVNDYRDIYYRDNTTHLSDSVLYQNPDGSGWKNSYKYVYLYDSEGRDSILILYSYGMSGWVPSERYTYTYEALTGTTIIGYWDGTTWVNFYKYIDEYDTNNNYLGYTYQSWDGTTWVNSSRYIYTYNDQDQEIEYKNQDWDGAVWVNDYRETYEYNSNGDESLYTYENYVSGEWVSDYQYAYEYDSNNKLSVQIYKSWDGTVWVNNSRTTYTYELVTGIEDDANLISDYHLYNNFPNPFNPTTKIEFSLLNKSQVTLKIYNLLGKEIATLVNGEVESGLHSIDFNATSLSSGVYFYKIDVISSNGKNLFSETKKMILLK